MGDVSVPPYFRMAKFCTSGTFIKRNHFLLVLLEVLHIESAQHIINNFFFTNLYLGITI